MMRTKNISTFISSLAISLLLFTQAAHAQSARKVIAELQRDTIPFFRGFAVSADLIGPLEYALSDYGQFEASLRINLKDKYFPTIEVGLGKADRSDDITLMEYKTSAPFGRIGCDFNIMKDKHDIYRILIGARYAFTSFKYDLYHPDITDPVWGGESPYQAEGVKCSYHWLELAAGVDVKIWGPLHLGWSLRYKRRIAHNEGPLGNAWYVPGYGKSSGSRISGLFNITFEI